MIGKSVIFGSVFLGIDFVFYFLIFCVVGVTYKAFPLSEAMLLGGESIVWRIIYLQALLQLLFVSIARHYNVQNNLLLVLVCVIVAFLIESVFIFGSVKDFWKLFTFSHELRVVGEGLVLVISAILAWLIIFKLTKWSESL